LGLSLAGCVRPVPAQGPVRVVAPAQVIYNKTALVGQTTAIDFAYDVNPDCSVKEIPTIRVINPPVHGTVQIFEKEDFTAFAQSNSRFDCNKKKSKGAAISYTPNPGYVGGDYLEFETFFSNGTDRTAKIAITVK